MTKRKTYRMEKELICILFCVAHITRSEDINNGGWHTDEDKMIARPGPCNIDVVDLTKATFTQQDFEDYYAYEKPLIIKGATDNTKFQKLCEKSTLLEKYGDKVVRLSSANTYSYSKRDIKLKTYVDEIMRPQTLDTFGNAAGTGVPFHFHGPGFGEVVYGRKRWFMYPPNKQPVFNPNKTTLHWLMEEYNNLHPADKPQECTINKGEIIYFPDRWWHGTLNIDTSVFISTFLG